MTCREERDLSVRKSMFCFLQFLKLQDLLYLMVVTKFFFDVSLIMEKNCKVDSTTDVLSFSAREKFFLPHTHYH